MKKRFIIFPVLFLVVFLAACGREEVSIEDYEWKMRTVMSNDIELADSEEVVIAVGEKDELYPNAKVMDITLVANDGKITVEDETNKETYNGSYKVIETTPDGINYEVIIDGVSGYATVSPTEYSDGTEIPTLPINMGDYSVYFHPVG